MSVAYEVNLSVDATVAEDFRRWLAEHVHEILALPGFVAARTWRVADPPPPAGTVQWCVQYTLSDRAELQRYLQDHAPRLRAAGVARFGDRFSASRRVLLAEPPSGAGQDQ